MEVVYQDINLILPSTRVHMVLMQPFVYFENPYTEPYRWERRKRDAQIAAINRTLGIARVLGDGKHAHFTIFPEYSIPGLRGVGTIDEVLRSENWPSDTVVIGGVDGLSAEEYRRLCAMAATEHTACNAPENVVDDNWVNVAVTWTKDSNDHVTKWVQPKLKPNELERNTPCRNMHEGRSVFLFSAMFDNNSPCRFLTLVCFDWIASIEGENTQDLILSDLEERWNQGDPRALHWVFVIQQNADPNHSEFIRRTEDFLLDHCYVPPYFHPSIPTYLR